MSDDITHLIATLTDPDPATRSQAAERLCQLGGDAIAAAVPLVRAFGDESEEVREWAVAALEGSQTPSPADIADLASLLW